MTAFLRLQFKHHFLSFLSLSPPLLPPSLPYSFLYFFLPHWRCGPQKKIIQPPVASGALRNKRKMALVHRAARMESQQSRPVSTELRLTPHPFV